jgi:putative lipoprotein
MDMGDYGSSEYKYYFKDGYLFYHEQNGKRIDLNTKNPGETVDVNLVMHFNESGNLVGSRKTIDFKPVELHDIEAPGVLKHCELIVEIANQKFNKNL